MNEDTATPLADRLLGFDSRSLQREMTDGLADWHWRRREAASSRRLVGTTLGIVLVMVSCATWMTPTLNYRLGSDVSYEHVVEINKALLRQ